MLVFPVVDVGQQFLVLQAGQVFHGSGAPAGDYSRPRGADRQVVLIGDVCADLAFQLLEVVPVFTEENVHEGPQLHTVKIAPALFE